MKILVTGSEGFIGRHVVAGLRRDGHEVAGLDLVADDPVEQADVREPLPTIPFAGVDVVVHLAGRAGVAPSLREPTAYVTSNTIGTANVLAAAARGGAGRVVLASSSSIYGDCTRPARETDPPRPLSPYASSKVGAEALAARAAPQTEVVVMRPFTVFGPGQRPDMLIARLLDGETSLRLWPFRRDFTPVEAVADAVVESCTVTLRAPFEVFNLGSGRPVSANELLDAVGDVIGSRPIVQWGAVRPGEPRVTWADPARARDRLGFHPATDLRTMLAGQLAAGGQPERTNISVATS